MNAMMNATAMNRQSEAEGTFWFAHCFREDIFTGRVGSARASDLFQAQALQASYLLYYSSCVRSEERGADGQTFLGTKYIP